MLKNMFKILTKSAKMNYKPRLFPQVSEQIYAPDSVIHVFFTSKVLLTFTPSMTVGTLNVVGQHVLLRFLH